MNPQRWAAILVGLAPTLTAAPGVAAEATPGLDPGIGQVEVLLDRPKDVPYVGEMIMLRVRVTVRGMVALESLRQPPLTNFNWQQLGRDKLIQVMRDGFNVPGFERDIAIYPQQAGRLIIEPFVDHATLVVGVNQRVEADFASKPVYVDVQRHEGVSPAGTWWLPARSLAFRETWSPAPDAIDANGMARRIVTVEAAGLTADRLPPPPVMRAPGVITFAGPAKRETVLTPEGPVARATYQWDIRPVSGSPAKMPALHMAWFDTVERRMRDAALPEHWVSYVGAERVARGAAGAGRGGLLMPGPLISGVGALVWMAATVALVLARWEQRDLRALRRPAALRRLRWAARRGDAAQAKAALIALARIDPLIWRHVTSDPETRAAIAALDAALFGCAPAAPPDFRALARRVVVLWRAEANRASARRSEPAQAL